MEKNCDIQMKQRHLIHYFAVIVELISQLASLIIQTNEFRLCFCAQPTRAPFAELLISRKCKCGRQQGWRANETRCLQLLSIWFERWLATFCCSKKKKEQEKIITIEVFDSEFKVVAPGALQMDELSERSSKMKSVG